MQTKPRNAPKSNALSEIGEKWTEKYSHSTIYDDFAPCYTDAACRLLLRVLPVVKISSLGRTSVSSGKLIHEGAYKSTAGWMGSTYITVGTQCRQYSTHQMDCLTQNFRQCSVM